MTNITGSLVVSLPALSLLLTTLQLTACGAPAMKDGSMADPKTGPEQTVSTTSGATDPYLWLEDIDSAASLAKVREWNSASLKELEAQPVYKTLVRDLEKVILTKDRIPYGRIQSGYVYNFWQDEKSVRGIWRRTTAAEYRNANPNWEVLLDIDQLAKAENENWVFKGSVCYPPEGRRCLLTLSRGGGDAAVRREFDVETKKFVAGGFELPEAKGSASWFDADTLFVSTDFGPGTMTKSGYARQVRVWQRGEPLAKAKLIFEAGPDDNTAYAYSVFQPEGTLRFVALSKNFYETELYLLRDAKTLKLEKLPLPLDFDDKAIFGHWLIGVPRTDWKVAGQTYKTGALLRVDLNNVLAAPQLLFDPGARGSVDGVARTKEDLLVLTSEKVRSRMYRIDPQSSDWKLTPLNLPADGVLSLASADAFEDHAMIGFESFLQPSSLLEIRGGASPTSLAARTIKTLPPQFNASGLMTEQYEATSKDGTKVPYFIVRSKSMKFDGTNPTLLYGYGGFMQSMTPHYSGGSGKAWLERGGVYVLANIRGGGEFGPAWHEAALKENRQRAYDDFEAIADDLIFRKVTTPRHLGIMGGSNGGLLMGVSFTQRPDLFNAVVCQVPLLDMLRYHKLLAGYSWMAEYGDPDDPAMKRVISSYSPYQNLHPEMKYPRVFFITSTRDDRVHPGHARKMAARMEEQKHPFLYFENIEGGHGADANLDQRVTRSALEWTYLNVQLVGP